jgi:tetratricopeptide (TPR) repeat protein
MRQFGSERLAGEGGDKTTARRHAEWYSSWAIGEFERLGGAAIDSGVMLLERERPNLLAALRWALDEHDDERALATGLPLSAVWLARDYFDEGCVWIERLISSVPPSPRLGAVHVLLSAMLLSHNADAEGGLDHARRGTELLRGGAEGDRWIVSLGVSMQAIALDRTGAPDEAHAMYDESVQLARELGDLHALASSLCGPVGSSDSAVVRACLAEAAELYRSLGSDVGLCRCGWLQAVLEAREGNLTLGIALAEEAAEAGRRFGPNPHLINALTNLGLLRLEAGDADGALTAADEAYQLARRTGNTHTAETIRAGVELLLPPD